MLRDISHSPSLWKASRSNPRPSFLNCTQNDATSVPFCLTTIYYYFVLILGLKSILNVLYRSFILWRSGDIDIHFLKIFYSLSNQISFFSILSNFFLTKMTCATNDLYFYNPHHSNFLTLFKNIFSFFLSFTFLLSIHSFVHCCFLHIFYFLYFLHSNVCFISRVNE